MKLSLYVLSLAVCSVGAFAPTQNSAKSLASRLQAASDEGAADTRREFMTKTVATGLAAGMGVLAPSPANAVKGTDKVNSMLKA